MYFIGMNLCIRGYIPVIAGKYDVHAHMCLGRLALLYFLLLYIGYHMILLGLRNSINVTFLSAHSLAVVDDIRMYCIFVFILACGCGEYRFLHALVSHIL